jgi:RNA polymerase sigma factor (sigma-70 family)
MINATDEELVICAQKGNEESFAELVCRYRTRLMFIMQRYTSNMDDAEDLAQDTFIKAYQNIQKYKSEFKFSVWLFTIARRLAINHYHHAKKNNEAVWESISRNVTCNEVTQEQPGESLWALAESLPNNQYHVLWLMYVENMSVKEISRVMGKTQVNIKVLLYRARKNMATQLKRITANDNMVTLKLYRQQLPETES